MEEEDGGPCRQRHWRSAPCGSVRDTGVVMGASCAEASLQRPHEDNITRTAAACGVDTRSASTACRECLRPLAGGQGRHSDAIAKCGGRYSCTGTAGNTAAPCGEESKYSNSTRGHLWRRHAERLTRVRSSLFCGSTGLFETLSSLLIGLYCVHTPMPRYYPRVARVDVWHSQNSRIFISH